MRPAAGTILCLVDDLGDPGARGFSFGAGKDRLDIFVVRRDATVFGYVNQCPHAYTTLDFPDDRFLTRDGDQILCGTHGARFEITTGFCTLGPCSGRSLRRFAVQVRDGAVLVGDQAALNA